MRVLVDGVRLFFDVEGAGLVTHAESMAERPTLVLLHGGPGADHSLFKPEFSTITDVAQVVYLDQRGSGRSDRAEPATWTWQRWADDVAEFCQVVEIHRPILVGSSSGGLIAMVCARRHPELVAGLVLDSTFGGAMTIDESLDVFERRGGPLAQEAARRYLGGDTSPAAAEAWATHAAPVYGGATDGNMAARRARARMNVDVQAHFRQGQCGPTLAAAYGGAVTCPTLILAGQDDPVVPAAAQERLAASLTDAEVEIRVLPGVGHGVFRQAPEVSFELVRRFLRRLRPAPAGSSEADAVPEAPAEAGVVSGQSAQSRRRPAANLVPRLDA